MKDPKHIIKARKTDRELMRLSARSLDAYLADASGVLAVPLAAGPLFAGKAAGKRNSSRRNAPPDAKDIVFIVCGRPDEKQQALFRKTFGCARWMWNHLTADKLDSLKACGKVPQITPASYKKAYPWLSEPDSFALCNVQLDNEAAFSDWLAGRKGKPRFKKKGLCRNSYTTNNNGNNLRLEGSTLILPKAGAFPVTLRRNVPEDYKLKRCTVSLEPDGKWMFALCFEYHEIPALSDVLESVLGGVSDPSRLKHAGLDMSLPHLFISSDGKQASYLYDKGNGEAVTVAFEKAYRKLEARIAKEQRKLSRMKKGSRNYEKQCKRIASLHAKAKHERNDFLQQLSTRLIREYDVIFIEDLDMAAMKRSLSFGKSVSDNGWGAFVAMLEYKAEKAGKLIMRVDKWFPSSRTCSCCGNVWHELTLKDRTYICPKCGHAADRDIQAAQNIDREGMRIIGLYASAAKERKSPPLMAGWEAA